MISFHERNTIIIRFLNQYNEIDSYRMDKFIKHFCISAMEYLVLK